MIDETRKTLSRLVEINRALAIEAEASRREATSANLARDELKAEVETLRERVRSLSPQANGIVKNEIERVKYELQSLRQDFESLCREKDTLSEAIRVTKNETAIADERFQTVNDQLRRVGEERDSLKRQLAESLLAMEEIRSRLAVKVKQSSLGNMPSPRWES